MKIKIKIYKWIREHYNKICGIKKIGRIRKRIYGKNKRRVIDVWYNDGSKRTGFWALKYARLKKEIYEERKFRIDEHVHHVDGDTLNDKIKNLEVMKGSEHISLTHKGKHLSKETKIKISNAKYGKCFSEEHKKNLSISHKGKHPTEETKKKMSISCKGKNNPMYGKHLSKEAKIKLSVINKGKRLNEETRRKMSENNARYWLGKHRVLSEETKRKISISMRNHFKNRKKFI